MKFWGIIILTLSFVGPSALARRTYDVPGLNSLSSSDYSFRVAPVNNLVVHSNNGGRVNLNWGCNPSRVSHVRCNKLSLEPGTPLKLLSTSGGWKQVSYKGSSYWIAGNYTREAQNLGVRGSDYFTTRNTGSSRYITKAATAILDSSGNATGNYIGTNQGVNVSGDCGYSAQFCYVVTASGKLAGWVRRSSIEPSLSFSPDSSGGVRYAALSSGEVGTQNRRTEPQGNFRSRGSRINFIAPTCNTRSACRRSSKYGPRKRPCYYSKRRKRRVCGSAWHPAWDVACPSGTPVVAMAGGIARNASGGGYGNSIVIDHGKGADGCKYETKYSHLRRGQLVTGPVRQGQRIAKIGSTGVSTGPHLDAIFYKTCPGRKRTTVNPSKFLRVADLNKQSCRGQYVNGYAPGGRYAEARSVE